MDIDGTMANYRFRKPGDIETLSKQMIMCFSRFDVDADGVR